MGAIFKKCHCGEDAVLVDTGPDFKNRTYKRTFKCREGHVFEEKSALTSPIRKTLKKPDFSKMTYSEILDFVEKEAKKRMKEGSGNE